MILSQALLLGSNSHHETSEGQKSLAIVPEEDLGDFTPPASRI